ncbi:hypothetical protein EV182_007312, partial [Spiromyces aspiralis]
MLLSSQQQQQHQQHQQQQQQQQQQQSHPTVSRGNSGNSGVGNSSEDDGTSGGGNTGGISTSSTPQNSTTLQTSNVGRAQGQSDQHVPSMEIKQGSSTPKQQATPAISNTSNTVDAQSQHKIVAQQPGPKKPGPQGGNASTVQGRPQQAQPSRRVSQPSIKQRRSV